MSLNSILAIHPKYQPNSNSSILRIPLLTALGYTAPRGTLMRGGISTSPMGFCLTNVSQKVWYQRISDGKGR